MVNGKNLSLDNLLIILYLTNRNLIPDTLQKGDIPEMLIDFSEALRAKYLGHCIKERHALCAMQKIFSRNKFFEKIIAGNAENIIKKSRNVSFHFAPQFGICTSKFTNNTERMQGEIMDESIFLNEIASKETQAKEINYQSIIFAP